MISQALREAPERERSERRAYLLNLRGIVYYQQQKEPKALADLQAASAEAPQWHIPWYNLGLCHKHARRWVEADAAMEKAQQRCPSRAADQGLLRAVLWNRGIAQTALGRFAEVRRTWRLCGLSIPEGSATSDASPPELDMGLAQLSLPTQGPYAAERVWVQRLDPVRARLLSVVRYGAPCQFGDIVLCDGGDGHTGFCDGLTTPEAQGFGKDGVMLYLGTLDAAGYTLHVVQGDATTAAQATALTERLREVDLHIEVWSMTMRLPDDNPAQRGDGGAVPLCAGLVLPRGDQADPVYGSQLVAERAAGEVADAARELGLSIYAPSLLLQAGDELGAARHRKALRGRAT